MEKIYVNSSAYISSLESEDQQTTSWEWSQSVEFCRDMAFKSLFSETYSNYKIMTGFNQGGRGGLLMSYMEISWQDITISSPWLRHTKIHVQHPPAAVEICWQSDQMSYWIFYPFNARSRPCNCGNGEEACHKWQKRGLGWRTQPCE